MLTALILCLLALVTAGIYNPGAVGALAPRTKLLDTVTGISATETDSTVYDLQGKRNMKVEFLSTLNTGFSTGSVFFKGSILGCNTPDGTFTPIPGLETAELVVDVAQTVPSASNAPGVVWPRFIKVKWTETSTMTSFTGTARLMYDGDPYAVGAQHDFDERGG